MVATKDLTPCKGQADGYQVDLEDSALPKPPELEGALAWLLFCSPSSLGDPVTWASPSRLWVEAETCRDLLRCLP